MRLVDLSLPARSQMSGSSSRSLELSEAETVAAIGVLLRYSRFHVSEKSELLEGLARRPSAKLALLRLAQTLPQVFAARKHGSIEVRGIDDLVRTVLSPAVQKCAEESRRPVGLRERARMNATHRLDDFVEMCRTVDIFDSYALGGDPANAKSLRAFVCQVAEQCRKDRRERRVRIRCNWPLQAGGRTSIETRVTEVLGGVVRDNKGVPLVLSVYRAPGPHDRSIVFDGAWRVDLGKGLAGLADTAQARPGETFSFEYHFRYSPTRPDDRWRALVQMAGSTAEPDITWRFE